MAKNIHIATVVVCTTAIALVSCGGARKYTVDESAYRVQQQRRGGGGSSGLMAQAERSASQKMAYVRPQSAVVRTSSDSAGSDEPTSSAPASKPPRGGSTGSRSGGQQSNSARRPQGSYAGKAHNQALADGKKVQSNMDAPPVVYLGYLRLRVKRRLPAVDAITKLTEEAGGYIQTLQQGYVIARIPARDFDKVMTRFAAIGEVLDQQVKALDVSAQFTDLGARLEVYFRARERLLLLLKTVKDVQERLRVVQEVKRLSEEIESIESTLATLRNLVSYFTITIQLDPIVAANSHIVHRSPFPWVRKLQAHRTTLTEGKSDIEMQPAKGFVLFDDDDDWRAQSADTSIIRAARTDNEPRGDADFWLRALHHEMDGRDETKVKDGTSGKVKWAIWSNKDLRPRYWLVGVYSSGEDLFVVEAFMPTKAAYDAHIEHVLGALKTFGAK